MALQLLGAPVVAFKQEKLSAIIQQLHAQGITPSLAILLVGDDAASHVYCQRLQKLGAKMGIQVIVEILPTTATEVEVLAVLDRFNCDPAIHAILPMQPLPKQLNAMRIIERLQPEKDVDALHPLNTGLVAVGKSQWAPCTPRAVMAILDYYKLPVARRQVAIIGRSNVVGKPLAHLLLAADATVTICHSQTPNLVEVIKSADIVVAAAGKPGLVGASMIKPGAVVIDVGINATPTGLVGDVVYDEVESIAAAVTPVPGGVGTVSTIMVMEAVLRQWLD